jgi:DHA1 family bicyclomycin/chloramphenicol resistance-like MFS transporter
VIVPAIVGPTALVLGLIEARYGTIGLWPFLLCFAPQIATISLIGPNSMAMALQRYPHMAGTASSLMGVMQFGIGAIFGAIVGQTMDGTIAPMTTAMGIAGTLCLVSAPSAGAARLAHVGSAGLRPAHDHDAGRRPALPKASVAIR